MLREIDRATQEHGLVVPAGTVSHTGIGGLALGGGVGGLMRRFGLTIDSLISAEVVTADSHILRASATDHADLFWAIRGGGGNFGVVTAFELALHELSELLILAMIHQFGDARTVLERARETMTANPPDELYWTSFLRKAPPGLLNEGPSMRQPEYNPITDLESKRLPYLEGFEPPTPSSEVWYCPFSPWFAE